MARSLQGAIVLAAFRARGSLSREKLLAALGGAGTGRERKKRLDAATKAVDRLITRGLAVGIGVRTAEKWFIKEVRLTPAGRHEARRRLGVQQRLPLEKKRE